MASTEHPAPTANPTHGATATTQAHGGAADHGGAFPPFDSTHFASQLIWLAITFGLLYALMSRVALPRVGRILENRGARIASDVEAAKAAQTQAQNAQTAHEKTLLEARTKAQEMGQETHRALAAAADAERKALEADLNAKMADADAKIAATKAQAMTNVDSIAKDAAAAIVSHLTGRTIDAAKIASAVGAAMKG